VESSLPRRGPTRRLLGRVGPFVSAEEGVRIEQVLSTGRAVLAFCALVAIYLDPTEPTRYARLAYALLILYVLQSVAVLVWTRAGIEKVPRFPLIVHTLDIVWAAVITMLTEGPNSPFFMFFVFVLLAAAYRWGFRETVTTAVVGVALLSTEGFLVTGAGRQVFEGVFALNRFIVRATYLVLMGALLGYLAEGEKQIRAEASVIAHFLSLARVQGGLRGTLQAVLDQALRLFDAPQALVATQEFSSGRAFLWQARREPAGDATSLECTELEPQQMETYFFPADAHSWHLRPRHGRTDAVALDAASHRLRPFSVALPPDFAAAHPFHSLLVVTFHWGEEWRGRLFLLDPGPGARSETEIRFAQTLLRQVSPAIYNVYLLRRLRAQAGAMERARVARELHDGAIQSLLAAEMEMDVLGRRATQEPAQMADDLAQIKGLLHQEVLNLRELMDQLKPLDVAPRQLLEFLADTVERFRRETGIAAQFVSEMEEVPLPPRACRELARIVQEALFNVRKHSGARRVLVYFAAENGCLRLDIDDDGRGFEFSGRLGPAELEALREGPRIIQERLRMIGGQLTVESRPGRGARLEITLPQRATYG
jgi:signal transduction histidine kinase